MKANLSAIQMVIHGCKTELYTWNLSYQMTQVPQFQVQAKSLTKKCLSDWTKVWSVDTLVELVEMKYKSIWAASVGISQSWSPIEQVSDIVFVQILCFVCVDSLCYGYFNP